MQLTFRIPRDWRVGPSLKIQGLPIEQLAQVAGAVAAFVNSTPTKLTEQQIAILQTLAAEDAPLLVKEIERAIGWSDKTTRTRLEELRRMLLIEKASARGGYRLTPAGRLIWQRRIKEQK